MRDERADRAHTIALREARAARDRALAAERQLVAVEAKRARELELVRELKRNYGFLEQKIAMMEQTRWWRLGGTYWGLRDKLLRRR